MDNIINTAKVYISNNTVKIVSFDMFDTLVCRPVLHTKDMLRLFARRISLDYHLDIEQDRIQAPIELDDPFLSLCEIWEYIAQKKGLSSSFGKELAEKEFEFDLAHIAPKTIGTRLFEYTRSIGKRIVVISDMYYSSSQLKRILDKCGYTDISAILVSSEQKAVKRTGSLFKKLFSLEPAVPHHCFLHIGDNIKVDYNPAIMLEMQAIHIPSNRDLVMSQYGGKDSLPVFGNSLYESFIYGTAINFLCSTANITFSLEFFAHMLIYPMLIHTSLFLLNNKDIQQYSTYKTLYFASRDGFLMKQAYDRLSQAFNNAIPSEYLLTSRAACSILREVGCFDRMDASFLPDDGTLLDYINVSVSSESLKTQIQESLSAAQLAQPVKGCRQRCQDSLDEYSSALQTDFSAKKEATRKYYASEIGAAKRVLLVDCGFNGTIASMLTEGCQGKCKFDKVYLWNNKRNHSKDLSMETRTIPVFSKKKGHCLAPIAETFFSECSGSCIGFAENNSKKIIPIFEPVWYPPLMMADISFVQSIALEDVNTISESFSDVVTLFETPSLDSVMDLIELFFANYKETATIFKNIRFKETYSHKISEETLATMMIRKSGIS